MALTVKAVATMAGVSVRTLHHYDQIGLLKPADTSRAGYRLYSQADLERLQQVLFFKELGFSLAETKNMLDSPDFDRKLALAAHKQLLLKKRGRLDDLLAAIDKTQTAMERGTEMTGGDMFDGFDDAKIEEYKKEAKERWGKTEAYKESKRRTSKYTKADWDAIKAEEVAMNKKLAALMDKGPDDAEVQGLIGQKFRQINERFYACGPEMFRGLGQMYVTDDRFKANYEKIRPGMAEFMRKAMDRFCDEMKAT